MGAILRKHGVATTVVIPVIKAGSTDFAAGVDWTPATGDVKISKDDGNVVNVATLPVAVGGTGSALFKFSFSASEMTTARLVMQVVDAATKAVEDQSIVLETYGNASAQHAFDLDLATQPVNLTQMGGVVQSATDLKDFADDGYDPATNKVQGVVLVDTTTTNTDVRGTDGVDTATMRGTDSAALASVCTEPRLAELDAANLPTDVSAVKTDTGAILVDTADMQPKLGSPATDISADIAAVKVDTAAILVDTGTTLDTKINDIQGATFSSATDSLEAIRDRGDSAWTTGGGGANPHLLQNTTIATLASQTSFTLTAGSADNDAYNGAKVVVTDSATATQKAVGLVSDYIGATKTITLDVDPGIFTMAVGDTVDVISESKQLPDKVFDSAGGLPTGDANGRVDIGELLGTAIATPTVAGVMEVDLTHLIGVNQSAIDLKDFADAGYDPATNKVQGVVLVDTTTTNTDMRGTNGVDTAAMRGTDGVDTAAMRGTDSAALASVCTETRLAELDAANLPTDVDAILADTADMQPKLGTPAADVSADIAAVKVDTAAILIDTAVIGVAGAGLTDLGGMSTGMKAEVNTEVDLGLTDVNLDHLMKVAVVGADVIDNSVIAKMTAKGATADFDTFVNTTDSLEAIRDRGDSDWSATSGNPNLLQNTTIATLASQTSFTLTAGSADDDAYNGSKAIITDSATSTQKACGLVLDYVGSTKTITLAIDPGIFTMAVGDEIDILAEPKQLPLAIGGANGGIPTGDANGRVTIASAGLDNIVIETGINARQALSLIGSANAGKATGLGTTNPKYQGMDNATERINATTDKDGNRSAVTLTPPA